MKRLHLHVNVPDLDPSIAFYATLFGAPPNVVKHDYAKWMLEDPKVNFAISQRGRASGVDHVGIQVESPAELRELAGRLKAAGAVTFDQQAASCCYAVSDKSWVSDPAGVRCESFYTFDDAVRYGEDEPAEPVASSCCGVGGAVEPKLEAAATSCCGSSAAGAAASV